MRLWSNPKELKLKPYYIPRGAKYDPRWKEFGRWAFNCSEDEQPYSENKKTITQVCTDHNLGRKYKLPTDGQYWVEDYFGTLGASYFMWVAIPEELWLIVMEPEFNEYGEISP